MFSTGGPIGAALGSLFVLAIAARPTASGGPARDELKPGDTAPAFTLPASDGQTYSLADFRGRTVVLAWFPKAFTGG
jgi:cytochrome oxidase Cu insertion factor (SCO1/SenC/PrrC family)